MGRRRQGQDRRPARAGVGRRLPLPGRAERRPHGDRRRRDVQVPPAAVRDPLRQGERPRRRLRRRPRGAARRDRRPRGRGDSASSRCKISGQRAPDHAVAHRDRRREREAARQAPDRDDAARDRSRVRRQGGADRDPRPGPARPEDPAPEDRDRARREERLAASASTSTSRSSSRTSPRATRRFAQRLRPYVADTSLLVDHALRAGKRVLLEGAQGTLLDLDHGTYPFVTSSNPIAGAAATGIGIGPTRIDEVIGVSKAYVTRVGAGPFPSEMDDELGGQVRELGQEFGTVTGRERRPGWLDLVALRYAVRLNGITSLALTKLDVLSTFDELQVCVRYRLPDGTETPDFPAHQSDFHHAEPVMETVPGLGRAARRLRDDRRPARGGPRLRASWSSARSTCRSGSSVREPRASRCSRRRSAPRSSSRDRRRRRRSARCRRRGGRPSA